QQQRNVILGCGVGDFERDGDLGVERTDALCGEVDGGVERQAVHAEGQVCAQRADPPVGVGVCTGQRGVSGVEQGDGHAGGGLAGDGVEDVGRDAHAVD